MKRISAEPCPNFGVMTASALVALVAAVAATAIATAAAVSMIGESGAGSSIGIAIFIAAVLAAAASGLLAACIAEPPAPLPAALQPHTTSANSNERQIVIPLTTVQDGLKTLVHITKGRQTRPTRRRSPKKRYAPDEINPTPPPISPPSSSLAFHERCGRILQTCDLLVRHFPARRTLCILRTAESILARRPYRPVEPETTWESDIDVDLDPVLSAPDLDEALRRLDLRIRSARKYKERNERLRSTSLVLEAEKRRAIRSSAEHYLTYDALPADIRPEPMPPDPVVSVDATEYYPTPKARSSLLQFYPTDSSHDLPAANKKSLEGLSYMPLCSTEEETTGFTSSRNDFTSSIGEMNSELYSTNDSSVRNESEIFSSSSLEKEAENVDISPFLIQSTFTSPWNELDPEILQTQSQVFPPASTVSKYVSSNVIESEDAASNFTQSEERLSRIEGTKTPPRIRTSPMTAVDDAVPAYMPLVAELSEDDESENWSSIVQVVAYGLAEGALPSPSLSIETEDSTLPLPKGAVGSISFVCEKTDTSPLAGSAESSSDDPLTTSKAVSSYPVCDKTDASSLAETVSSSSASVETEDSRSLPLTKSESASSSFVCEKTGASSLSVTVESSSASVETEEASKALTKSEAVSSYSVSERTDASSIAEIILPSALVESEDSTLPLTNNEAVSSSSISERTDASSIAEVVSPSTASVESEDSTLPLTKSEAVSSSSVSERMDASSIAEIVSPTTASVESEESSLPLTNREAVSSSSVSERTDASSIAEIVLPSALVESEGSSLPLTNSEAVSSSSVSERTDASYSTEIVSSSLAAVISNNAPLTFEEQHEKLTVSCITESFDGPATAIDMQSTSPEQITDRKILIRDSIAPGHVIKTTGNEAAPAEGNLGSNIGSKTEDFSMDSGVKTDTEGNMPTLSGKIKFLKSELTFDLSSVAPSKIELEFEKLSENTSPPTDDVDKSFIAVSSDIAELNEIVSDEREARMDPCVSPKDANEDTRFSSHVAEAEMERTILMGNDSEMLISDENKMCLPDLDTLQTRQGVQESSHENVNLQTQSETSFNISNEDIVKNAKQFSLAQCTTSRGDESDGKTGESTLIFEEKEGKPTTDSFCETESKFDREIQSLDVNLGTEVLSDCASDSSSMSVSPNPDISLLRSETNLAVESSEDTIKVHLPVEKKELPQQTMDDFGFGEPLMVVTARKVTTYVDDTGCSTQRNFGQKRRVRISTEDSDLGDVSEVHERKIGLVRPSVEKRRASTLHRFAPFYREHSPPEINTRKPLKPKALRPFGGCVRDAVRPEGGPCSDALPGHFYRSLERPMTFDHSSSFPLSMTVPHRRAFWDYKLNESQSDSPRRQPSIKMTGIVHKCKETFQTLSSSPNASSPLSMDEGDLPENHRRRFQEARCFFQNLAGGSKDKTPVEPDSTATEKPEKRVHPTTVAERFNVTGIYQDVLGDGAAKTAAGAPLRGVPRREAVVATLHSFRK